MTFAWDIAEMDPITYSAEGLDDGCFFCGADAVSAWDSPGMANYRRIAHHEADCLWVRACGAVGRDLGENVIAVDGFLAEWGDEDRPYIEPRHVAEPDTFSLYRMFDVDDPVARAMFPMMFPRGGITFIAAD